MIKFFFVACVLSSVLYSCTVVCDSGYETRNCNVAVRDKFIGNFAGSTICSNAGNRADSIYIAPVANDVTKITINNLTGLGYTTSAVVTPSGTFSITNQPIGSGTISGDIVIDSGKIAITYMLTENNIADNCKWKQQ